VRGVLTVEHILSNKMSAMEFNPKTSRIVSHCYRSSELMEISTYGVSRGGYEPTTFHITLGRRECLLQVIVRFVDIGGIVEHHCLNFLFIIE